MSCEEEGGDAILELSLTDGFRGKNSLFVIVESLFCLRNEGQGLMRQLISANMALSHQESCELTDAQQGLVATVLSAARISFS